MNDQLTLGLICHRPNRRPTITDTMRKRAAAVIVDRLIERGVVDPSDCTDATKQVVLAARFEDDGCQIAATLSRRFLWECDMATAEVLDRHSHILTGYRLEAETLWAAENPWVPQFKSGEVVTWRGEPATITGVNRQRPYCYELRQGDLPPWAFYVAPFEDVRASDE